MKWLAVALVLLAFPVHARAEDEPTKWEQLFFPFPIVGAPPQLEQQVQVFNNYFRGDQGSGNVLAAELAYIASAHVGLVLTVPFQIGIRDQTTGFQDINLLVQYLAAGSLEYDAMVSVGLSATFPTGHDDLSEGDYFVGPFAYAAKRWFHRLVLEGDLTAVVPLVHGASTRQVLANAMVAVMLTPQHFDYPVYAQVELDTTTFLDGSAALPPGAMATPAATLFLAPEIFVGPFKTPINDGTRLAAGVSFELAGDPVHRQTYMFTAAFDIPNRYGY